MDLKLAQIYGNAPNAVDLEKLAAAELADSLADDGNSNLDTSNLTDDQYEELAAQVLAGDGDDGAGAAQGDPDQDAQEKVAEADYMGRVMAHAYVNELRSITKQAESGESPAAEAAEHKSGKKEMAKKVGKGVAVAAGVAGAAKGIHHLAKKHGPAAMAKMKGMMGKKAAAEEKQPSAMDQLVNARMHEILEQSGIDPASLKPVEQSAEGAEKTAEPADGAADPREALMAEVDRRSWEALAQYGVEPAEAQDDSKK